MNVTLAPEYKWWYRPFSYCYIKYHIWFNREPNLEFFSKVLDRATISGVFSDDK